MTGSQEVCDDRWDLSTDRHLDAPNSGPHDLPMHPRLAVPLVVLLSCSTSPTAPTIEAPETGAATSATPAPLPAPALPTPPAPAPSLLALPLVDHGPATVMVPQTLEPSRPVIVALHAHAIRPEHACERWFRAAGGRHLVLCPHGLPRDAKPDQSVTLGDAAYTKREIDRGLEAMRLRFGDAMSKAPPHLVGWSHGAKIAIQLVMRHPLAFEDVALGEGGYAELDGKALAALKKREHRRLLLLCTTSPCATTLGATARRYRTAALDCQLESHAGNKHPFDGEAVDLAARALPWLFEESRPRVSPPQDSITQT